MLIAIRYVYESYVLVSAIGDLNLLLVILYGSSVVLHLHVDDSDRIHDQLDALLILEIDGYSQKTLVVLLGNGQVVKVLVQDSQRVIASGFALKLFSPFHRLSHYVELLDLLDELHRDRKLFYRAACHIYFGILLFAVFAGGEGMLV